MISFQLPQFVLLLPLVVDDIVDCCKVDRHSFYDLFRGSRGYNCQIFILNHIKGAIPTMLVAAPTASKDVERLANLELYFCNSKLRFGIVDTYFSISNFVRIEDVLVKLDIKPASSFVTAAASDKRNSLLGLGILNKLNRWFMNHKHLLVFKQLILACHNCGFDGILHNGFGTVAMPCVMVHNSSRNVGRQLKLKRYCVITWCQVLLESEAVTPEPKNISVKFFLNSPCSCLVSILVLLSSPKACLLFAFNFDLQYSCGQRDFCSDIYLSIDNITSIVIRSISLHINISALESGSHVNCVSHIFNKL